MGDYQSCFEARYNQTRLDNKKQIWFNVLHTSGDSLKRKAQKYRPLMLDDTTSRIFIYVGSNLLGFSIGDRNPWLKPGFLIGFAYGFSHQWNLEVVFMHANLRTPEQVFDKQVGEARINSLSDWNIGINRVWRRSDGYLLAASAGIGLNTIGIYQFDSLNLPLPIVSTYGVMPRLRITVGRGNINYWGLFLQYSPINFSLGNRLEGFRTRHIFSPGIVIRANF